MFQVKRKLPESRLNMDKFEGGISLLKQYYHCDTMFKADGQLWLCNEIKEISYEEIKNSGNVDDFNRITSIEFAFWGIITEWGYDDIYDLPHDEFTISTPNEVKEQLPLFHKLFENYHFSKYLFENQFEIHIF